MKFNSTNSTPASPPLYRSPSKIKKFSRRKKNFKHSRKRSASGEGRRDRSSNQRSCQFSWNFTRANIDHQLTASSRLEPDSYQFSFQFFPPLFHRHSERPLFFPSPPRCGKIRLLRSREFSIYVSYEREKEREGET